MIYLLIGLLNLLCKSGRTGLINTTKTDTPYIYDRRETTHMNNKGDQTRAHNPSIEEKGH